jgi:hypothetical protein
LKITQEKGFEAIQCMALSVFTQKICSKLGFEEIFRYMTMIIENSPKKCPKMPKYISIFFHRIQYGDYKQNGQKLFDSGKMGQHQQGILFARKL